MPTAKLDAINTIISTVGSGPVSSLTAPQNAEIVVAQQILDEITKELQIEGWHFNTEEGVEFSPSGGTITLDENILRVSVPLVDRGSVDVVARGRSLYDRKNKSSTFDSPVTLDVVRNLDWDSLPDAFQRLCYIKAARVFAGRLLKDIENIRYSLLDEEKARTDFEESDSITGRPNIFDSYSEQSKLDRYL